MNPELAWMVAIFWIGRKLRCEVSMAPTFQTVRTALEGLIWRFSLTWDALLRFVGLERTTIERLTLALVVAAAAVPR